VDLISRLKSYEDRSTRRRRYTLTPHALERLDRHLATLVHGGGTIHTCETGCGSSTVAFSHYAASHIAICDVHDSSETADIEYVRTHPEFRPEVVSFVLCAKAESLFAAPVSSKIDVLLLNGSHAYPNPELEYLALGRYLKPQGILALSDIRVPTVKRLFDFLLQDESLRLHQVSDSSAFFTRLSDSALHDARDWRAQRYNRLFYPAHNLRTYSVGYSLPFSIAFDGGQTTLPSFLTAGFALRNGVPAMEGSRSTIVLPLDQRISGDVEVVLGIKTMTTAKTDVTVTIHWEGQTSKATLTKNEAQSITTRAHLHNANRIRMILSARYRNGTELHTSWANQLEDHPFPAEIAVTSIEARFVSKPTHLVQGQRITRTDGTIVKFEIGDQEFQFLVTDPHDSIQAHHFAGQIYELEELTLISRHLEPGCRILDVGANIGNHAIWFEKSSRADRIVVVEPQAPAISLLKANCLLNSTRRIDQSFLGVALGKENGRGRIEIAESYNAAGGRLILDENGPVQVASGDDLLGDSEFDFIKIDVEGAELDVLKGLASLIHRCAPIIFVEVWDHGRDAFLGYVEQIGYRCVDEFRRYPICSNLLLKPESHRDTLA
jgi:FkbM family methyltransferase